MPIYDLSPFNVRLDPKHHYPVHIQGIKDEWGNRATLLQLSKEEALDLARRLKEVADGQKRV